MNNPYISIFSTQDIPKKTKELTQLWEKFITKSWGTIEIDQIRHNVFDSWKRCLEIGVNPRQMQANASLSDLELRRYWHEAELFQIAKPIIDDYFDKMTGTGYLITLADQNGHIVYVKGEPTVLRSAEKMNFAPGVDWSEASAGTNAIGTSIVTRMPIQILSAEHFCEGCHPWTCSSAPIIHPFTKDILGAIDFTGFWGSAQPHTLGLAISLAQIIESKLTQAYLHLHSESKVSNCIIFPSINKPLKYTKKQKVLDGPWRNVIGTSEVFLAALHKCQKAAVSSVPILLLGESGTGKEKIAQSVHETSQRKNQPFLAINCGAIQKELIGSELFGYEKGAFTGALKDGKKGKFEEAHGGTLFLDEIGEMPLELQVHLLRVLQEKEITRIGSSKRIPVNVRIIAATNKNLFELCKKGLFREDLLFRLNVVSVNIPPLRERENDLGLVTDFFIKHFSAKYNKDVLKLSNEVAQFFTQYRWPGNIRELQNVLEHAVLFCEGIMIEMADLPTYLQEGAKPAIFEADLPMLDYEERKLLVKLLDESGWNLSAVAKKLKIARSTLYRRLKKYQLKDSRYTANVT